MDDVKGWVYVIENPSLPGLIKIGFTLRTPKARARELSKTGLPHDYTVSYAVYVDQPQTLEQVLHARLKRFRYKKEWFKCDAKVAYQEVADLGVVRFRENIPCSKLKKYIDSIDVEGKRSIQKNLKLCLQNMGDLDEGKKALENQRNSMQKRISAIKADIHNESKNQNDLMKLFNELKRPLFASNTELKRWEAVHFTLSHKLKASRSQIERLDLELQTLIDDEKQTINGLIAIEKKLQNEVMQFSRLSSELKTFK